MFHHTYDEMFVCLMVGVVLHSEQLKISKREQQHSLFD